MQCKLCLTKSTMNSEIYGELLEWTQLILQHINVNYDSPLLVCIRCSERLRDVQDFCEFVKQRHLAEPWNQISQEDINVASAISTQDELNPVSIKLDKDEEIELGEYSLAVTATDQLCNDDIKMECLSENEQFANETAYGAEEVINIKNERKNTETITTVGNSKFQSAKSFKRNCKRDAAGTTNTVKTHKRARNEHAWKRKAAKRLRDSGMCYISKNNIKSPKTFQSMANHKCRFQCASFQEEERKEIFEMFWSLGSWNLQTAFLTSCMEVSNPKRRSEDAKQRKNKSISIKLKGKRVCRLFFTKTLNISKSRYEYAAQCPTGTLHSDKRGKHIPSNKISNERKDVIRQHINSFPRYMSHYSKSENITTDYLSPDLNVKKMYELYCNFCAESGNEPVKESYYRFIFNTEFNLKFKKPHSQSEEVSVAESLN